MSAIAEARNGHDAFLLEKNFPAKLYKFLNEVEQFNIAHIASWQPHGRSFRVHDQAKFLTLTEPRWFLYKKYASFQRQLNIYGFTRITDGIDKNSYYHVNFVRGREKLLYRIHRIPIKQDNPLRLLATVPVIPNFTSSHDNNQASRVIAEPESASRANITQTEGYNTDATGSTSLSNLADHPTSLTFRNETVSESDISLASHGRNLATTPVFNNDVINALLQRVNHPSDIPSINTYHLCNDLYHQMNHSPIFPASSNDRLLASLLRAKGGNTDIIALPIHHISQLQRHDQSVPSQTATFPVDPVAMNLIAMLHDISSLLQTGQNVSQQQRSMINSVIEPTALQRERVTPQLTIDSHPVQILSSLAGGALVSNPWDDVSLWNSNVQPQPQQIVVVKNALQRLQPTGNITALSALHATVASGQEGNAIGINHNLSSDNENDIVGTSTQVAVQAQQQQNDSPPATTTPSNEVTLIANVLALYRSRS